MRLAWGELRRVPYKNELSCMFPSGGLGQNGHWSIFEKNLKIRNSARKLDWIWSICGLMRGGVHGTRKNIRIIRWLYHLNGLGMGIGHTCKIFKSVTILRLE